MINRRTMLQSTAAGLAGCLTSGVMAEQSTSAKLPVRTITRGPKFHWFGYYDKHQFDPGNRFVLSNEVDFEHRTPTGSDRIKVGMVDTHRNDQWIELGESRAWGWQQGCMLQWVPGTQHDVIWNDREADQYVARVMNVTTGEQRTLPHPIYTVSPDGKFALTADFARIQRMSPGYGYVGVADPHADERAPDDSGVFKVNLATGETTLVLSLAEMASLPFRGASLDSHWHYFNHLLVSPDSQRFIVLHRWRDRIPTSGDGNFTTRMITANIDGSDRFVVDPSGSSSHFIWRDPQHICMWTRPVGKPAGYYLFKDQTREVERIGEGILTVNGHNTYLPATNNEWILTDTYPDSSRRQHALLYHVPTRRKVELGAFLSPPDYRGEWRCDTHPRSSRDGRLVCIDSPHVGPGRQLHLIDVSGIVEA